jgi:hypothetical protein
VARGFSAGKAQNLDLKNLKPNGPPEGVKPSALWLKLQETPAPSEIVPFPRRGRDGKPIGHLRIMVLTAKQFAMCQMNAHHDAVNRHKWDTAEKQQQAIPAEIIADCVARQVLCMACTVVEPDGDADMGEKVAYAKAFPSPESLLELSKDELAVLFSLYGMVQAKWGPVLIGMSDDQQDAWIARLAEGGSAFPLRLLDSHQRDQLTLSVAKKLWSLCRAVCGQFEDSPTTLASLSETLDFDISCFGGPRLDSLYNGGGLDDPDVDITIEMATELERQRRGDG